jgi:hypothetical protein
MSDLTDYLDSVRSARFSWGENDCALFAAKYWDIRYGTEVAEQIRALGVRCAKDYRRLLRSGNSLSRMTVDMIGPPVQDDPEEGDVVLVRTERGAVLGIAVPPVILCAAEIGFAPIPLILAEVVWRKA